MSPDNMKAFVLWRAFPQSEAAARVELNRRQDNTVQLLALVSSDHDAGAWCLTPDHVANDQNHKQHMLAG